MNEYMEFVRSNALLVMGFLGVLGLIIYVEFNRFTRKYKVLDVNQSVQLLNRDETVVLDVRENKELHEGRIQNARHITLGDLDKRLGELEKHKQDPVLVYCRSGTRSGHACNVLAKAGFENVNNLSGGIMAWESANLPLTKR